MQTHLQVIELNPEDSIAKKTVARLQPIVAERQEKMKDEMLGKNLLVTAIHTGAACFCNARDACHRIVH